MDKDTLFLLSLTNNDFFKIDLGFEPNFGLELEEDTKEDIDALLEKADKFVSLKDQKSNSLYVKSAIPFIKGYTQQNSYYGHFPRNIGDENLPDPEDESSESGLINSIKEKIDRLLNDSSSNLSAKSFGQQLFSIFKRYAWCIKSFKAPDTLSVFEHLKSKAAWAHCLHAQNKSSDYPFILLCGDLSGIQDFIYDIHSNKAAQSLKGRSFYLQLLFDAIVRKCIKDLDITTANLIYSTGGKFYFLLPNTSQVVETLKDLEITLTENLWEEQQEKIYLCLDYISFNLNVDNNHRIHTEDKLNDLEITGLGDLWKAVTLKASRKKQLKLKDLMVSENIENSFFDEFFRGGLDVEYNEEGTEPCAVTGRPTTDRMKINDEGEEIPVHIEVQKQIRFGRDLRRANFLVVTEIEPEDYNDWVNPIELGFFYRLLKTNKIEEKLDGYTYLRINPTYKNEEDQYIFIGGNKVAEFSSGEKKGDILPHNEIAMPDEGISGFNKLGILRMDIDNLGQTFVQNHSNEYATFAQYSALSEQLDWFFSAYLNSLRTEKAFRSRINIIYGGGDDLFILGRWKELIGFTKGLRTKFRKYVGGDDILTISAGLILVNPKFPISKAASMAKDALEEAKHFLNRKLNPNYKLSGFEIPDKNAIHLFGLTLNWSEDGEFSNEFDFVIQLAKRLKSLLENQTITKGFIYKLFVYKTLKNANKLDWIWQSAYNLSRYESNAKEGADKTFINATKKAIVSTHFQHKELEHKSPSASRMLDLFCLAGQLADYYSR